LPAGRNCAKECAPPPTWRRPVDDGPTPAAVRTGPGAGNLEGSRVGYPLPHNGRPSWRRRCGFALPTPSASATLSPINDDRARDLIRTATLVQRLRAALNDGASHGRTDPDLQRDTLARLIDPEVRPASPRGTGVLNDG